jgi:Na+-transporting methylmalonyl-CoA/oxaloacetate decarboxylase gamma subunit
MNQETGIWIAGFTFAFAVLAAFARFVHRLSQLESRVEKCEEEDKKADAMLARLIGQMQIVSETLGAVRLHAAEHYVPLERMGSVEEKIDDLGKRSGSIEAKQAEQGATLKSIEAMIGEIKRSMERH